MACPSHEEFFNRVTLGKLGTLIGEPLFMDKATAAKTRVSYARICVRVKAGDELPTQITITDAYGIDAEQEVQYEWIPPQCRKCKAFGHDCEAVLNSVQNIVPNKGYSRNIYKSDKQVMLDKSNEWRQQPSKKWVKKDSAQQLKALLPRIWPIMVVFHSEIWSLTSSTGTVMHFFPLLTPSWIENSAEAGSGVNPGFTTLAQAAFARIVGCMFKRKRKKQLLIPYSTFTMKSFRFLFLRPLVTVVGVGT